ncbi:MAG: glycosyltransferase family protein [Spirochaetales bacterium]
MRIAYSCAGEGLGHAARLVALSPYLEERYKVFYFVPSHLHGFIQEKVGFSPIEDLPYFRFVKEADRVRWLATAFETVPRLIQFPQEVEKLVRKLKKFRIQGVITDYDPYLAWAGKLAGIPVLQLNHPGIIARKVSFHPLSWLPALTSLFLEGPWTERMHISFFLGDVGPLFRESLFRYPVRDEGYLLVNLKSSYRAPVLKVLEKYPGIPYRLFPNKGENFEEALAGCRAVLSSAGHQIIAEALVLSKPILVIPQKGQWEQQLNASMLKKTRKGEVTSLKRLEQDLPQFLSRLEEYRSVNTLPLGFTLKDGTKDLVERIEAFFSQNCTGTAKGFLKPSQVGKIHKTTPWKSIYPLPGP